MRPTIRFLVGSVAAALVASCSDVATAPNRDIQQKTAQSAPSFDLGLPGFVGGYASPIIVTTEGGSFSVDNYTVTFPPNSICDPSSSSYGATEWDQPCDTLPSGTAILVFATVSTGSAGFGIDFSPALRFSPNATVTIATNAFANIIRANTAFFLATPSALNKLAMYYAPSIGAAPSKDFASDRSLVTHVNLTTGIIWRRVKHFSGYLIASGQACTPSPDVPDCVYVDR